LHKLAVKLQRRNGNSQLAIIIREFKWKQAKLDFLPEKYETATSLPQQRL
jgi:hypothetical protein